jgi:hypothetical protein
MEAMRVIGQVLLLTIKTKRTGNLNEGRQYFLSLKAPGHPVPLSRWAVIPSPSSCGE